ncbi:MAG: hypothetical protein FJY92_07835 [Candidatus Hydrogenedentes bacterium]|nr:hypothetical protein [Candidatus Hydrogenedentota bacterium]
MDASPEIEGAFHKVDYDATIEIRAQRDLLPTFALGAKIGVDILFGTVARLALDEFAQHGVVRAGPHWAR